MLRGSGVLLHVSSLPSSHGIGDIGPGAHAFVDRLAEAGQRYWQILPLNPVNPGAGNSPYFSSGSLAANPLLLSIESLREEGLLEPGDCVPPRGLPPQAVDFAAVTAHKLRLIERAHAAARADAESQRGFETFCAQEAHWLDDYALFTVIKERQGGRVWSEWPLPLRQRDPAALARFAEEEAESLARAKFGQYLFHRQWLALRDHCRARGIEVLGDIPIYVSYDSADVWADPGIFKLDAQGRPTGVSGVPPDYFSATGQLWNNPVYDWDELERRGFDWWLRRMGRMFAYYDIVRIDHFRGLVRFWEVPAGAKNAMKGQWRDVPVYRFFDALRTRFVPFRVIAEDLGIITDDVREVMSHYAFPGMKVLQFAFGSGEAEHPYLPHNYERNCVVYTGTHDNNTTLGWLDHEATDAARAQLARYIGGERPEREMLWELIRLAEMSVADLAIIPAQDLLGLGADARMNTPSRSAGNWVWRLAEGQLDDPGLARLAQMTRSYGRAPRAES